MSNENTTKIGKITNYDGYAGNIVTEDDKYIFNINDFTEEEPNIQNGDIVNFIPNNVTFGNESTKVARFIEKVEQKKEPKNNTK